MVSIIKNQLLKHLSRYTKNLSADKINLSTFKGEGELSNLELDEIVLTDLLELPSWLRLTSAWCNKVAFRIQWTKLKSVPIFLSLDEVYIKVETCEELRSQSTQHGLSSYAAPGKYSFINKVVDGMTVAVNTVCVSFDSPAFTASVQISRILVESCTPEWERGDLRFTRLKESVRGQVLIFKELQWQTVRIEAKSTKDENLSPLRLLTNQARCRITVKKRLSDSFIVGSRLALILDDLLWVLTDSQLKAALCFLDSLTGLIQKSTELTRTKKAARKLEELPEYQAQLSQQARTRNSTETSSSVRIFKQYDVVETSYHFLSKRIDLHLCDDAGGGRSVHPDLKDGAALQISLERFQIDYYPYHLAIGNRKHWPVYREGATPHTQWLKQALTSFRTNLLDLIEPTRSQHTRLGRSSVTSPTSTNEKHSDPSSGQQTPRKIMQPPGHPLKSYLLTQLSKLMTSCVIMRIQDFSLYQITTNKRKQMPREFVCGDRLRYNLPLEEMILHAEFTYYYYPGDIPFPLPPPKFYVLVNPLQVCFDISTCLWLNAFLLNLYHSLLASRPQQQTAMPYVDVKIEAIMPRIIFESNVDHPNQKDRPRSLHIEISRASVTNVRTLEHSSRADLAKCVDTFQLGSLFYGAEFPASGMDFSVVTEKFFQHVKGSDNVRSSPQIVASSIAEMEQKLSRELLWIEAKDIWSVSLEPVWAKFYGTPALGGNKAVSFLDAFPLTLWIHMQVPNTDGKEEILLHGALKRTPPSLGCLKDTSYNEARNETANTPNSVADIHVLAHITNLVSVQINHYQYLFLLRLSEEANELATILAIDSKRIINAPDHKPSIVIGAMIPQVEVTFVMPSQSPGKECSGGDLESVFPDSGSLQDDNATASVPSIPYATRPTDFQTTDEPDLDKSKVSFQRSDSEAISLDEEENKNFFDKTEKILGINSVKKGFSNIINSLDSALKPSPDDASDTASLRSGDDSSESEKYVFLEQSADMSDKMTGVDAMFNVYLPVAEPIQPLELASEVVEEEGTTTSPSERSMDSCSKRRDLVSMSTFKLGQVELVQQSEGFDSVIKVQVSCVTVDECGSIPWDELQNKFDCRSRGWNEISVENGCRPQITARLTHSVVLGKSLSRASLKEWASDKLEAQVKNLDLELNMSTAVGLADMFEDEVIPDPMPLCVKLDNIKLHLNEDRPPCNITSPEPIAVHLNLSKLCILRGKDGVFRFEPQPTNAMETGVSPMEENGAVEQVKSLEEMNQQLLLENRELKRRLAALERVSEENHLLRQSSEESQVLRSCLAVAQDDVAHLLEEKRSLLDRLKGLQDQMDQSHRSKR